MATFITSKSVGETINIYVESSTGFWKYNHDGSDSSIFSDGNQPVTVTNANGEFTIISCNSEGTVSGDITYLNLAGNQLTTFDGTGLSSLTYLYLAENQLTSFDGTGLSSLTSLILEVNQLTSLEGFILPTSLTMLALSANQLTSFDGTGLSGLTNLYLGYNQLSSFDGSDLTSLTNLRLQGNQLTSFNGTGLSGLTILYLAENQLTTFDATGLSSLNYLSLVSNPITPSVNNQILQQLNQHGVSNGYFDSSNGRTSASNTDYDNLLNNLTWSFNGLERTDLPTFITSKSVGQTLNVYSVTSTGFWKYNHNGVDSAVFSEPWNGDIQVTNANGEFTLISCDSEGNASGDITNLELEDNQITSFDSTLLTNLTDLVLASNQLTSLDVSNLTSLTRLSLYDNQLTSLEGFILPTSLTELNLHVNQFTSFDTTGLSGLHNLQLGGNQLTTFDGTGLPSLTTLNLQNNPLTSFVGGDMGQLTQLNFQDWNITTTLTSFDGTGLSSLTTLMLFGHSLTSFDGAGMDSLTALFLRDSTTLTSLNLSNLVNLTNANFNNSGLISFDTTGLSSLIYLDLEGNSLTSFDGSPLINLTDLGLYGNQLTTFDGTGLSSLQNLELSNNPLTTFIGGDMGQIVTLQFQSWGITTLTSFDATGLSSLNYLSLVGNPITPSVNNQILQQLSQIGLSYAGARFDSSNGRTSESNTDYNNLLNNLGWYFEGLDLIAPPVVGSGRLAIRGVIVEPSLVLPTTLEPNDSIDGYIGTSTGYVKVSYWDGTTEILGNGTPDNKDFSYSIPFSKTVSSDDTYSQRTVTINSCDVSGAARGNILTVNLSNSKFSSVNISNLSELLAFGISRPFTCNKNLTKVKTAYISQQESTSIDLTIFPQIDMVMIDSAPNLVSINASGLLSLNQFYVRYNPNLTSIDLTDSVNLMVASFETNNKLSSIIGVTSGTIIPNIQVLTIKQCDFIDSIDLSNMNILNNLTIHGMDKYDENTGQWTVLPAPIVVNNMPIGLTTLNLNNSSENYLDFSRFPNLTSLEVNSSLAETIDLGSFNGGYLVIGNNDLLTTLDTTNVVNLSGLFHMSSNDLLSSLDVQSIAEVYNGDNFRLEDNALITSSVIDDLLIAFDSVGKNGKMFYSNVLRTSASNAAKANLISKGWSLYGLGGLMQ